MQRRFKVVLTWNKEDKVYVATVPAIPGCSTFGDTQGEALAMAEDVIKEKLLMAISSYWRSWVGPYKQVTCRQLKGRNW